MQQGLEAALAHAWCALAERAPAVAAALRGPPNALSASAPAVLTASEFVLDALCRDPKLWPALLARAGERLAGEPLALPQLPPAGPDMHGSHSAGEAVFMAELRRWRRAEFTRIAWRDIAQWASLDETLAQLSHAAECALRLAQQFAERSLALRFGQPRNAALESQQLIIVAMGKLGGGELNFSSDIDLVLLYPENGQTDGATPLDNQEYFTRLAQLLLRLLEQPTEEGFVFRVDLRLRPFGDSGPVVSSAAALEDYLQIHGRDWERYAWVKARAITNEASYAQLLRTTIRPFVYRRYLDFGVLESLAHMKELIEREVQRRELADNIKLGDGGIREIEFIVQSFQLIRGGQDRRLQGSSLRRALPLLAGVKLLPSAAVAELDAAYVFLRRVENRLQMRADQQVHRLPSDELERERLARSMGCAAWPELAELIGAHRGRVAAHFRALILGSTAQHAGTALPLSDGDLAALSARLDAVGLKQSAEAARLLLDFAHQANRRLDQNASRRLAALLPLLIDDIVPASAALPTLRRVLQVLEAIGSRSAYLALLQHNTRARLRLVQLASHGDFLIGQIAAHPLLLDELLDQSILDQPPDRAALAADLEQRMDGADQEDEEQLIERLCQFQRAAFFRLGVADLFSRLPVMQVSDRLTDIAELIVERALVLTWQQLAPALGVPMCGAGAERRAVRLCVVGYGKLGGMELSYASDLDLVFLHDSSGPQQETEGSRRVDNQLFFLRFAQRMVHLLSMHSASGRLYEVDMRLRPSGKAGMLITGIDAFAEYQRHQAWTWEHQALLHARAVAGAPELIERFETLRTEVLRLHVRRATLRQDVGQMRNRQRAELSRTTTDKLDLKQDPGGIGDIEFLAQYWALKWARGYPPLVHYADTIRQLESLASADLVAQAQVDVLTGAYRAYRTLLHHHALEGGGELILPGEFAAERAAVKAIWEQVMGT